MIHVQAHVQGGDVLPSQRQKNILFVVQRDRRGKHGAVPCRVIVPAFHRVRFAGMQRPAVVPQRRDGQILATDVLRHHCVWKRTLDSHHRTLQRVLGNLFVLHFGLQRARPAAHGKTVQERKDVAIGLELRRIGAFDSALGTCVGARRVLCGARPAHGVHVVAHDDGLACVPGTRRVDLNAYRTAQVRGRFPRHLVLHVCAEHAPGADTGRDIYMGSLRRVYHAGPGLQILRARS